MKTIVFVFILLSLGIASAKEVVIDYPSFQGKPILARKRLDSSYDIDARAHIICRLAGHVSAAMEKTRFSSSLKFQSTTLIKSSHYFIPESLFKNTSILDWMTLDIRGEAPVAIKASNLNRPVFKKKSSISKCAKVSSCRGFDPKTFYSGSFKIDINHPFIQQCYRWANESSEPFVFSQVTCHSADDENSNKIKDEIKQFHSETKHVYEVTQGDPIPMNVQFANVEKSCAPFKRMIEGNLERPKIFECDYQPFDPITMRYHLNVFPPTFMNYLSLTGRYKKGPKPGPANVQQILNDYSLSVIPEEYGMSPELIQDMEQAFCVESVSEISIQHSDAETNCKFKVNTKDFLQAKNTLELSFGIENSKTSVNNRCETLAQSFSHEALSCEKANFCPAPGLIQRGDL